MESVCSGVIPYPPPSAPQKAVTHDYVFWGIVMCEVAVTFIALGANVQRYGLTQVTPDRMCGCFRCARARRLLRPACAPRCNSPATSL